MHRFKNYIFILVFVLSACSTPTNKENSSAREALSPVDGRSPSSANGNSAGMAAIEAKLTPIKLENSGSVLPVPKPPSDLFRNIEPLKLIIRGPFPLPSDKKVPVDGFEIRYTEKNKEKIIPVKLETRGKSRKDFCAFDPIRINWGLRADDRIGTVFDQIKGTNMKLVVHCEYTSGTIAEHLDSTEKVLKEYAMYKLIKAWGLPVFEVRLVEVQYQNPQGENLVEGMGFFIEPNAEFGSRYGLKHRSVDTVAPTKVGDSRIYLPYILSRIIINATDYDLLSHNTENFYDINNVIRLAVPYDFNDSTLVKVINNNSSGFPNYLIKSLKQGTAHIGKGIYADADYEGYSYVGVTKEQWSSAYVEISNALLARKDLVFKYVEYLPISEEAKIEIKTHLTSVVEQLKAQLAP